MKNVRIGLSVTVLFLLAAAFVVVGSTEAAGALSREIRAEHGSGEGDRLYGNASLHRGRPGAARIFRPSDPDVAET